MRSWWVILFITINFTVFSLVSKNLDLKEEELKVRLKNLNQSKHLAIRHQNHLIEQIESFNDPHYVELVLRDELGLVSEGQTQVQFTKN